jgi:thiol-disulfide isomerase/thioredoxin
VKGGDVEDVDWRRDAQSLNTRMPPVPDLAPPVFPTGLLANLISNEARQKAYEEYNARQRAYWQTEKGLAILRAQCHYTPLFESNGTFRIDNVPPGDYTLNLNVTNPERGDNYYEQIGSASKEVTVPPPPPGKPDEPFDLGAVELQIRGGLRVGKRAPPFETTTFAGKRLKLDDYKGKYVLLDFWATWSGPRTFDLQILKTLQSTYAQDERLVMIGLNFDHERPRAEEAIKTDMLKWTQCYVGPWGNVTVPDSYGIQGLPAAVLISPDGRIAGQNMRGSMIRTTVRNLLGPPRTVPK